MGGNGAGDEQNNGDAQQFLIIKKQITTWVWFYCQHYFYSWRHHMRPELYVKCM